MKQKTTYKNPEDFNSLLELTGYFNTELKCHKYYQQRRWGNKPICQHCGHDKVYKFSDKIRFKCAGCKKQFTVRTGTIFENSKVTLRKWFVALYMVINHKKGISSYQLARDIEVTQKTAWFMLHRLRHQLGFDNTAEEQLTGTVEIDETFVGGKNKNRHKDKKVKNNRGRSFKDKTPVLGILQRGVKAVTIVVPNTSGDIIEPLLLEHIKEGAKVITDEWVAYAGLSNYYEHYIVHHGRGDYGDSIHHTNNIESFWNWIKRMIMGVYHKVTRKHLQQYAHEATFRYNTRNMKQGERLVFALTDTRRTLPYKKLVA